MIQSSGNLLYILVYVDDLIVIMDNTLLVDLFLMLLAHCFSLKDHGPVSYFLGVEIVPNKNACFLNGIIR